MFRFATPWALALVPVALGLAWYVARRRRRGDARLPLPDVGRRLEIGRSVWSRLDGWLPWLRGAGVVLLVLAVARPQAGSARETVSSEGVDLVFALDVSDSMRAEDFQPLNRLEVARATIARFIDGRPTDRIGLVAFASLATTRCPLTLDHAMLRAFLDEVGFASKDEAGTALGMGLATAVNRLRASEAKSKVVVLITDGRNNRGQIGPEAAAEAAAALRVRVYTVGVGTEGEAPVPVDGGPFGKQYTYQRLDLDEELLREIARRTEGQYFRVTDPEGLQRTFERIDALEKTEVQSRVRVLYAELFPIALLPAAAVLLLEWLLGSTRLRRIP